MTGTLIFDLDPVGAETLRVALGPTAEVTPSFDALRRCIEERHDVVAVVLGASVAMSAAATLAETLRIARPAVGVILVRRRVDTTTLSDALRAGIREVVNERELADLHDAVRRVVEVATAIAGQSRDEAMLGTLAPAGHLVTVFSAKGGCGKTTLATNLAATLAANGSREVCLLDLDLAFGDVAIALQLFPAHTIADAVSIAGTLDTEALHALLTPHSSGLFALTAPVQAGVAESIPVQLVANVLRLLKSMFAYVVVDTPPAFTDHVLAAFDESDVIALIATLDVPALKNLKLSLETLELLNYPRERWQVVLNRADSKVGLPLSEVEKTLKQPVSIQIPSSRAVPASINRGVPIVLDEPNHSVSQAIRKFAERHVLSLPASGDGAVAAPLRQDRRGMFGRKAAHR